MDESRKESYSPIIGLIFGIMAVSTASLMIRFAQKEAPSLVIAAFRMSLAALIIAPFIIRRFAKEIVKVPQKTILLLTLSGLFLGLHFAFWITSLEYTSVASSVVLVTTAPLWVAILSPVFLKEKLTRWTLLGLTIALTGGIIVGLSSSCNFLEGKLSCENIGDAFKGQAFWGDLMALIGAWLSAGYLIIGRKVREKVSLTSYIFLVYSVAAIVLLVLVWITGEKITGYSQNTYLWMIGLAIVPQIFGHSAFNWALKYLSAAYVSIALLGEPIGTVILTIIFLKESPALMELVGGILILMGIFFATRSESKFKTGEGTTNEKGIAED
ncbi:MAG: DMT family transporter [Anaerolineaceae bacterium]